MKQIFSGILVVFIAFLCFSEVFGEVITSISLDPVNIIAPGQLQLTLDNNEMKYTAVNQNNVLYIDSNFFKKNFTNYNDFIKNNTIYGATLTEDSSGKQIECVPLYLILGKLNVNYTYDAIYGKAIIIIRTDKNVATEPVAENPPSGNANPGGVYIYYGSDNKGNLPQSTAPAITANEYPGTSQWSASTYSATGGYSNYSVPPGYGYYYPPGYQPGYYFGDTYVQQGSQVPSIYDYNTYGPVQPVNF